MKQKLIRNPVGRGHPLSEAADDASMYHGGIVTTSGPYPPSDSETDRTAKRFQASIDRGLVALENGTSEFASDVEPIPGAPIEAFDIFDVETGAYHMIWRVACRHHGTHAH